MACKYCGKDNQLVLDNILSGGVCEDCYSKVRTKIDSTKKDVAVFYDKLQSSGLMGAFTTYIDMMKRDNKLFRFDGVKVDKRSKFPYVLVFKCLSSNDVPELIEVSINRLWLDSVGYVDVVKGKYRTECMTNILLVDANGTFYAKGDSFIGSDMSWAKKEFGLRPI